MKATQSILYGLQAARLLIDDPAAWCKGDSHKKRRDGSHAWCMVGAVGSVFPCGIAPMVYLGDYVQIHTGVRTVCFNDRSDTTHADVLKMLDGAIARAGKDVFG